jgi:hypothetical protein
MHHPFFSLEMTRYPLSDTTLSLEQYKYPFVLIKEAQNNGNNNTLG